MKQLILVVGFLVWIPARAWAQPAAFDAGHGKSSIADVSGFAVAGATDCVRFPSITTSVVSTQIFTIGNGIGEVVGPAGNVDVFLLDRGGTVVSGKSDSHGYVRFSEVSPGFYTLRVHMAGTAVLYQDVYVVAARGSGPRSTIVAMMAGFFPCSRPCVVAGSGPFATPPDCLFERRK